MTTRQKTCLWLIGQPEEKLPELVLPTKGDVLKTFYHYHNDLKMTVPRSLKATTDEVIGIWNKARISTAFEPNIVSKMKSLFEEYKLLKKNKGRSSKNQKSKEKAFTEKLNQLFDIAHKDAERMIRIEEDKVFLRDQRSCRKMKMAGVDVDLTLREEEQDKGKERN